MADPATKKVLQELAKDESLKNKTCVDCGTLNPQWASISFAVFICLQCAGAHRGFGVHISFVRSISMDAWQDEQLRRMKLGGNAPFIEFLREYPAEGGYKEGMSVYDKYHCWAATQYREKLTAALEGKDWSPSPPPPSTETTSADAPGRPSSAQGLRKSRASTRASSSNHRQNSNSPAGTPSPLSNSADLSDRKAANESYFASLGASNATRPDNLPPSQGGRYTGFGNTPTPESSERLTSNTAPTLTELQSDPVRALSKGWSLFAGVVASASRTVSENVIQPGMERVADPELRERVGGFVSNASQRAAAVAGSANAWGRSQLGVDVGESMGAVVDKVRGGVTGGARAQGYEVVDQWGGEEGSALYADAHEDDFFKEGADGWQDMPSTTVSTKVEETKAKADDWGEWKDF